VLIQTYAHEVGTAGIRALVLQPGSFRTGIRDLSKKAGNFVASSTHHQGMLSGFTKLCEDTHDTQRGDPEKFANLTIELVKCEGIAAGKEVPLCLPVGPDSVPVVKARLEKQLKLIEEWENLLVNTDLEGQESKVNVLGDMGVK
jgi:hypothetical protein